MIYLLSCLFILVIIAGPQLLVRHVLDKYNAPSSHIPGTGAQFARHLVKRLNLANSVHVEETAEGDHYNPQNKTVYLNQRHFNQKSLAAIVIATHEVGHAIQDAENFPWLTRRMKLVRFAMLASKIAPVTLALAPVLLAITKSPLVSFFIILTGVLALGVGVLVHLITLPVEFDASFNKALPILEAGNYLDTRAEYLAARIILRAAALTYVAQALTNLLNIAYWLRIIRT